VGAGAAAAALPLANLSQVFAEETRPNFVFIMTDDQRWDAMSCMGNPWAKTPNIDRIAREGGRFANAFVTTSLCSPSRASFLTGRYASSHGIGNNTTKFNPEMPTFGSVLQKAGYDTAFIGKWHMATDGGPMPGWDKWISFFDQGLYWNPELNIDGKKVKTEGYVTDMLTDHAVNWLKQSRTEPFCLCLWHKAVHAEFAPATRHLSEFSDAVPKRPKNMDESSEGKPHWANRLRGNWDHAESYQKDLNKIRNYYRTLMSVDDSVGRVLDTLEDMGALDNTVVVFAGDNGFFLGEHGLGDKRAMYEESIRIPLVVRYPKMIKPGSVIDPMVLNIDVCPTLLDLAGVKPSDEVQGASMRRIMQGEEQEGREDWLYEYNWEAEARKRPGIRGIRTKRWKYITYLDDVNTPELYDLKNDPLEMRNVINVPSCARVLEDMKARLDKWLDKCGRPKIEGAYSAK
jgi:N-acetylglucosamine-6-sulfatase